MRRKSFFLLICSILWIGMLIRTFFWWNSKKWEETPQDTGTWFIDEIINTWNNTENPQPQTPQWTTSKKDFVEIKMMMPRYFYNSGRNSFKEDLYNNKKVLLNFIFIDDLNSYRDQLSDNFSWADLFLFPYDWNEKVSRLQFSPKNDIESMFDPLIYPITKNNQAWFLPFSADPMIMYTVAWYSWENSFYNISEYTFNRESIAPLSFPVFYWINTEDANNWFKREYQDIIRYSLMHYFETNNDSHDLQIRIDTNVLQNYNIESLKTILNAIPTSECDYFPSICFQIYNFVWIRFWFLSDIDIVNQYFQWRKSKFDNLSKFNIPFYQLESPVRIRWRWISNHIEDTDTTKWINEFLTKYMNEYKNYNLWNSTLPVFKSEEWKWLIDNNYIWLRWYILQSWWDYINTLKWKSKFRNLIWYQLTAKEYLRW